MAPSRAAGSGQGGTSAARPRAATRCGCRASDPPLVKQPDRLPPEAADGEPHGDVEDREDKPGPVPFGLPNKPAVEVERRGGDPVHGEAAHQRRQLCQRERRRHGRGAAGDGDCEERAIHGADVGRDGGEEVVRVEVGAHHEQGRRRPAEAEAAHGPDDLCGKPRDEALPVEGRGHRDERGEPDQSVPRLPVVEAVLPGDHPREQEQDEAAEGRRDVVDAERGAKDPEGYGDGERGRRHPLVPGHGPGARQLCAGLLWRVRRFLD
mmetsp:Transcript_33083/g.78463  ORF Transcript_33083/g.78463 Transcript_33083/m.78463 type:complete len:265 (-) Transcript_33083:751-1545(-)